MKSRSCGRVRFAVTVDEKALLARGCNTWRSNGCQEPINQSEEKKRMLMPFASGTGGSYADESLRTGAAGNAPLYFHRDRSREQPVRDNARGIGLRVFVSRSTVEATVDLDSKNGRSGS